MDMGTLLGSGMNFGLKFKKYFRVDWVMGVSKVDPSFSILV
jgi:hypothetical protein